MIYGPSRLLWTRHPWEADGGIDGVVDRRPPIGITGDDEHDRVRPPRRQLLVTQPGFNRQIGEENAAAFAGSDDQVGDQLPSACRARVDRDRALALVQPCPVEAAPVPQRPTPDIDAAPGWVDPDHVRSEE